jgi:cadmium resistance protein CadD (predicted permease)
VNAGIVAEAAGLFAVTNVDDILLLALFFGRAAGEPGSARRVVAGQYLGFAGILSVAVAGAYGATFLPKTALAYLGLLPLALGLRAAWQAWRNRANGDSEQAEDGRDSPRVLQVAAVTVASGSDNIGVYLPVFARSWVGGIAVYVAVFLILVAVWCAVAWFFASRPAVASVIARWGRVLYPLVLIGLGLFILVPGGAFGL